VLATGSTVFALEIQGFWVRHPEGWSMLHSDPSKGGEPKIFLVEKKDAFLYPGGSPPKTEKSERDVVAAALPAPRGPSPEKMKVKRTSANSESGDDYSRPSQNLEVVGRFSESSRGSDHERKARQGSAKKEEATEADLDAYRETMRAMCLDDRLSADELRFLAEMRRQRTIKEKQHFQVLNDLGITKERFTAMIKNDRDENKGFAGRSCVTCMDASADHVILRCFHLCLCEHCATELRNMPAAKQKCPKCSAAITEIQKVY